ISVSERHFERQLTWFRRLGYRSVPLGPYVEGLRAGRPPEPRRFAITFDDGYRDVFTRALPRLKAFGFTATLFAVPGPANNHWDDGAAALMSVDELRAWQAAGMEVGAHTC